MRPYARGGGSGDARTGTDGGVRRLRLHAPIRAFVAFDLRCSRCLLAVAVFVVPWFGLGVLGAEGVGDALVGDGVDGLAGVLVDAVGELGVKEILAVGEVAAQEVGGLVGVDDEADGAGDVAGVSTARTRPSLVMVLGDPSRPCLCLYVLRVAPVAGALPGHDGGRESGGVRCQAPAEGDLPAGADPRGGPRNLPDRP